MTPFKLPDRYVQTDESYEGGQGIVWIYHDTDLDRKVAVKFLKPAVDREQLLQEIASLRAIRSKHIAQIYDLQFHPRTRKPALIQEYVSGPDLWATTKAGVSTEQALLILYQIASGISDVHAAGKIHRDIKPTNIKSDAEGIFKLLDFGLTCDSDPQPSTRQARGTDAFRAPEMYGPLPVPITPAVDVYAFGVTAWLIFSQGCIPDELVAIPPQLPAPAFSTVAPGLRPEVSRLFDATLSASPGARPPISTVRGVIADHLLHGKHRALLSEANGTKQTLLSKPGSAVKLSAGDNSILVGYDGLAFRIQDTSPGVSINNVPCRVGAVMPQSCVITIATNLKPVYYLFDMSHPEVVL
jgi:serine/threonine protein kinase